MKRHQLGLAAGLLGVLTAIVACTSTAHVPSTRAATTDRALLAGNWTADALCPIIRSELSKRGRWVVQADSTNRLCVAIGQGPRGQNVGVFVDLRGGHSRCPKGGLTGKTHAIQVQGVGRQACLVTHTSTGFQPPAALAEWGITLDAKHSIDINCASQTNADLKELMPACRLVLQAVMTSLYSK